MAKPHQWGLTSLAVVLCFAALVMVSDMVSRRTAELISTRKNAVRAAKILNPQTLALEDDSNALVPGQAPADFLSPAFDAVAEDSEGGSKKEQVEKDSEAGSKEDAAAKDSSKKEEDAAPKSGSDAAAEAAAADAVAAAEAAEAAVDAPAGSDSKAAAPASEGGKEASEASSEDLETPAEGEDEEGSEEESNVLGDEVFDLKEHGGEDEGDVHLPSDLLKRYTYMTMKPLRGGQSLAAARHSKLAVVPKVGTYKDLPPGEYRTAGVGGMYSAEKARKCMRGRGGTFGGINGAAYNDTYCAEEVGDNLESNVVPVAKADCFEDGSVDSDCGAHTWQTWFKQPIATRLAANTLPRDRQRSFIRFFEFLGHGVADSDARSATRRAGWDRDTVTDREDRDEDDDYAPGQTTRRAVAGQTSSRGPAPDAMARAARAEGRRQAAAALARAMRSEEYYARPSNDGFMDDDNTVGRFGRNLRQVELSPAAEPTGWSSPGEVRMRAHMGA